jgi:hypothetical protein
LVNVTEQLGITAPVESLTVPVMLAVTSAAWTGDVQTRNVSPARISLKVAVKCPRASKVCFIDGLFLIALDC